MADKLAAYRAYDWDGDEEWRAYRLNLEVPPGKEALLEKKRAQWYKQNRDPDFDVSLVITAKTAEVPPSSAAKPKPTTKTSQQSSRSTAPPPPSSGSGGAASGSAGAPPTWAAFLTSGAHKQWLLLAAHLLICVTAVVGVQPLDRLLAYRAYFLCLRTAVVAFGYKVISRHGWPRFRPWPTAIQGWLQPVATSTDFFYFITCLLMMQNPGMWLGLVPVAILSLYHASAFLNSNVGQHPLWRRFGLRGHQWLAANKEGALRACAVADVAMGFQAILSIVRYGLRSGMLAYVYWNQLRLRFCIPDSRPYQAWAWRQIGARAQPLLTAVPALQQVIARAQRWFEQPLAQQQAGR